MLSHLYPRAHDPTRGIFVHEQVAALRARGTDARVLSGDVRWLDPLHPVRSLQRCHRLGEAAVWSYRGSVPYAFFPYVVPRGLWSRCGAKRYRTAALAAVRTLRPAFAFDLVHAHTAHLDGFAAAGLSEYFGVPVVLTEHSGPFSTQTRTAAMRRATRQAVEHAARVIAVSRALVRDIQAEIAPVAEERFCVIANGVDPACFRPRAEGPPADGTIRAVWVGHLVPIKRPVLLVEAFALAQREEPRLRLSLVGGGPLEGAVRVRVRELQLEDTVSLHPFTDRDGVAEHLSRSHFLVLASEAETFGVVVIEALACGRPVLSTRCGGPEEVVADPRLGHLVEGTRAGLARGLVALGRRCAEFDAAMLRAHAIATYGYEQLASRLEGLYREVLAEPSARRATVSPTSRAPRSPSSDPPSGG